MVSRWLTAAGLWVLGLFTSGHNQEYLGKPSTLRFVLIVTAVIVSRDALLNGVDWVHVVGWSVAPIGLFLDDVAHRLTPEKVLDLAKSLLNSTSNAIQGALVERDKVDTHPVDPNEENAG